MFPCTLCPNTHHHNAPEVVIEVIELADFTLAALLGHAVQGVTGKHYIRRSDATLIAAADKIADAIDRAMQRNAAKVQILHDAESA